MEDLLVLLLATIGSLIPITNPLSAVPVFVALSRPFDEERRRDQARRAAIYTAGVLMLALVAGALILAFFGISLYALRVGGGIVILRVGLDMLQPGSGALSEDSERESRHMSDIAFTPIAMPLLSGPGSIAVTIAIATEVERPREYLAVAVGIMVVAVIAWLVLRSAGGIAQYIGTTGTEALERVMGFLLTCIGVQFVMSGLYEAALDPAVIGPLLESIRGVGG